MRHTGSWIFVICCGYKGHLIKEYFANYQLHASDVTFDLKKNSMQSYNSSVETWTDTPIDTGEGTMTGGASEEPRRRS